MFGFSKKVAPAVLGADITPVNMRRYWWIFAAVYGGGMIVDNILALGFGLRLSYVLSYLIAIASLVVTAGFFYYENERVVLKKERRLLTLGSLAMSFAVTTLVMLGVKIFNPSIVFLSMLGADGDIGGEFFIALMLAFMLLYFLFYVSYRFIFWEFQALIMQGEVKEKGKKKMAQVMVLSLLSLCAIGAAFYGLLYFYMTMFPPDDLYTI